MPAPTCDNCSRICPSSPATTSGCAALGPTIGWLVGVLARDTTLWTDDVWVADSTPVECARSRETVKRSDLAGWAEYGYCASHSRFFWGLRLHLLCTLHGLPVGFALTGAKADERETLLGILDADPEPGRPADRADVIADKNYYGREFETKLAAAGLDLLRPARKGEAPRPGPGSSNRCGRSSSRSTTPSRANSTSNTTADTPPPGSCVRVVQRILALTAAIWHNDHTGQPDQTITDRLRPLTPWNRHLG